MFKVIKVEFSTNGKSYAYFTNTKLDKGDWVVVFARSEYAVVKVTKVVGLTQNEINRATQLIIQRVDLDEWHSNTEKLTLVQEIKNELRHAKEQQDEMQMYKIMSETNPAIKELLEKLDAVDKTMVPKLGEK